jgi:hypothetical protein
MLHAAGESILSFRAWSLASVFRSVECGSLPELGTDSLSMTEEPCLALTVISHPTELPTTAKVRKKNEKKNEKFKKKIKN